jgi:formylglycine-generating enzyme required for sulfatase activity
MFHRFVRRLLHLPSLATFVAMIGAVCRLNGGGSSTGAVEVDSGPFEMAGSGLGVNVSRFQIDRTEVSIELWTQVRDWANSRGYDLPVGDSFGPGHPVHSINWFDAVKWCNARSEMAGISPAYHLDAEKRQVYRSGVDYPRAADWGEGHRLPTEAEWEKAARGGVANRMFPWGTDDITPSLANYNESGRNGTVPVGSYAPNAFGLHDMAGNVIEWCWDWHGPLPEPGAVDPVGASTGVCRVIRGGGWRNIERYCEVAFRDNLVNPVNIYRSLGFRTVRTVKSTLLSGDVQYYAGTSNAVAGVSILSTSDGSSRRALSGANGRYLVDGWGNGSFSLTPSLETDIPVANGVTTADIALLRRHILGITPLDSAHKVLAGDVNGSSSVTTADITLIRRLILGISTNFTGGLWRFVPSDEVFTNALSPWTARRSRSYATAPSVMTGHDFKAIKLGDVNGSWKAPTTSGASTIQAKSKPMAQLVVGSGRNLGDGVTLYSVTLRGVRSLTSLQFTLAWDPAEAGFAGIEAGALKDLGSENLGAAWAGQGLVSVSWDPANGLARDLGGEAVVLGLKLKARPGRTLSRLTVPERPTALEVTEATVPLSVGVVGWSAGTDGLSALGGVGDSGGPTFADAGSLAAAARLRVLGPDAAGQVILEVTAAEGQTVQVQWSMDLKSWTSVWQGSGEGPQSPIRVEPQGLSPSGARFWRVIRVGR